MSNQVLNISKGHGFFEQLHTNVNGEGQHVIATKVDTDVVKNDLIPIAKALSEESARLKDMYPVRVIPQHVLDRSYREGWFNDRAAWKRWANSEEGRTFGVERNGKVPQV